MTVTEMQEDLIYVDDLTGIYNRRFFTRRFAEECEQATTQGTPLAMAMIDVDYFKSVNDSYGHQEGDRILRHVGETLRARCMEHGALPIRYGGDEFMVLMPGASRDQAVALMELIANDIRGIKIETARSGLVSVTISVGVASFQEDCASPDELYQTADRAVYRAKEDGRNRVCIPPSAEVVLFSRTDFHRLFPCPRLVGRHEMLNEIKSHLRLGTDIMRPVIVLEGPSGVGKSRLLDAAKALMDTQRNFLLHARGQPYLVNQPFGAIVDALRMLIRTDIRLAQRCAAYLTSAEIGAICPLIPDVAGLHLVAQEEAPSAPSHSRTLVISAILKMLTSAAEGKPMTVIVDDLQWCDPGTVEVLSQLKMSEAGRTSLVMVAMRKTGEVQGESNKPVLDYIVSAKPNRVLLPVEPLSYIEVREMMGAIIPGIERNNRLVQLVSHKSQALPLLVEEIMKFLIQRGFVESKGGQLVVNNVLETDIPSKIHDILAQRAMSLDDEVRNMVSTAAVVGQEFDINMLQQLEDTNEGELLGVLDKGVRTALIKAESSENFRFTSDDAQQAIYDKVDEGKKERVHAKVAEIEEKRAENAGDSTVARVAFHLQKAGKPERAINLVRKLQTDYPVKETPTAAPSGVVPSFVKQIAGQLDVQVRDLESADLEKVSKAVVSVIAAGEAAVEPLLNLVLSSNDLRARRMALQCLHRVTKGVVQKLLEELYRTQNYEEKCRVIAALGEYQNPKIMSELGAYVRYSDSSVRREALRVLERSRQVDTTVVEILRAAITDENEAVAQDAVAALGRLGRREVVPDLIKLVRKRTVFRKPRPKGPQREGCLALGLIGDPTAIPVLVGVLRDSPFFTFKRNKPAEVRAAAAMALGRFMVDQTRKVLERASRDRNEIVRSAAKMALTKMKGGRLVEDPEDLDDVLPSLPQVAPHAAPDEEAET